MLRLAPFRPLRAARAARPPPRRLSSSSTPAAADFPAVPAATLAAFRARATQSLVDALWVMGWPNAMCSGPTQWEKTHASYLVNDGERAGAGDLKMLPECYAMRRAFLKNAQALHRGRLTAHAAETDDPGVRFRRS